MKTSKHNQVTYLLLFLAATALCIWVKDEPFFWDTIQLGAMHADWFYQQNFQSLLLPDHIDSGHIPAFGWYLALVWTIFGQNLWVSHLAMIPWIFLVLIGLYRLLKRSKISINPTGQQLFGWSILLGMSLFLVDPVLISQLSLISPDVILVGAFLLGVNSILDKKNTLLTIAIIILGLISLRGVMVAFCLFIWQITNHSHSIRNNFWPSLKRILLPYLPGGLLVIAYLFYHFLIKGWVGVHEGSPWAESFAGVGLLGTLKQIAVLIWRMLDFGRIFLWLSGFILIWRLYKLRLLSKLFKLKTIQILVLPSSSSHIKSRRSTKEGSLSTAAFKQSNRETISLIRLAIILLIVLGLPAIVSAGLSQHRYFLPFFIIISLVFWQLLFHIQNIPWRYALWALAIIGLASGNKWIYPAQIAQGWDASLAHKPYFECKKNVKKFISEENILPNEVGSVFPEVGAFHYRYLDNQKDGFQALDMEQQQYVFYSNVMNDFTDEQLYELQNEWKVIFKDERKGVSVFLYKNQGE